MNSFRSHLCISTVLETTTTVIHGESAKASNFTFGISLPPGNLGSLCPSSDQHWRGSQFIS